MPSRERASIGIAIALMRIHAGIINVDLLLSNIILKIGLHQLSLSPIFQRFSLSLSLSLSLSFFLSFAIKIGKVLPNGIPQRNSFIKFAGLVRGIFSDGISRSRCSPSIREVQSAIRINGQRHCPDKRSSRVLF